MAGSLRLLLATALLLLLAGGAPATTSAVDITGTTLSALSSPIVAGPGGSFVVTLKNSSASAVTSFAGLNLGLSKLRANSSCYPATIPDDQCPAGAVLTAANSGLYVAAQDASGSPAQFTVFFAATLADLYTLTLQLGDAGDPTGLTYSLSAASLGNIVVVAGGLAGAAGAQRFPSRLVEPEVLILCVKSRHN